MPDLVCSVENCGYNSEHLCSLNKISVDGSRATNSESTCCASFVQQSDSFRNCADCGSVTKQTEVGCEAENCVHNKECICKAEAIDVCGCGAQKASGTECATFCCK